jgi:hypothetical protein
MFNCFPLVYLLIVSQPVCWFVSLKFIAFCESTQSLSPIVVVILEWAPLKLDAKTKFCSMLPSYNPLFVYDLEHETSINNQECLVSFPDCFWWGWAAILLGWLLAIFGDHAEQSSDNWISLTVKIVSWAGWAPRFWLGRSGAGEVYYLDGSTQSWTPPPLPPHLSALP